MGARRVAIGPHVLINILDIRAWYNMGMVVPLHEPFPTHGIEKRVMFRR